MVSGDRDRREIDRYLSEQDVRLLSRVAFVIELLIALRKQDLQAAGHFMKLKWGEDAWPMRCLKFAGWALFQAWINMPRALHCLNITGRVSRTPMWLEDENPWEEHPWAGDESATFPD